MTEQLAWLFRFGQSMAYWNGIGPRDQFAKALVLACSSRSVNVERRIRVRRLPFSLRLPAVTEAGDRI